MQFLVVTPEVGKGYSVVQAPSATRAIVHMAETYHVAFRDYPLKAPSAYPGTVIASLIRSVDASSERVTYRVRACQKDFEVEFVSIDGMLFNPYADLHEGRPHIHLLTPAGQITPFGELFLHPGDNHV